MINNILKVKPIKQNDKEWKKEGRYWIQESSRLRSGRKSEVKSADQNKHDNGRGIQNRRQVGVTRQKEESDLKINKGKTQKLSKAAKAGIQKATEKAVATFKENGQDFVMEISVPEDDEFQSDEESEVITFKENGASGSIIVQPS